MKKFTSFLFAPIMFMIVMNVSSCKKEEKTPPVTKVDSKKELLVNNWKMSKYEMDSVDVTQDIKDLVGGDIIYVFKYDNSYVASINGNQSVDNGKWEFTEKETITLTSDDSSGNDVWTIVKLVKDNLWVKYTDDDGLNEVQFITK